MNLKNACRAVILAVLFAWQAQANEPALLLDPIAPGAVENQDAGGKEKPKQPDKEKKPPETKLAEPPQTDIFSQALLPRVDASSSFNPHMMGDFYGYFALQRITLFGVQTITTSTTVGTDPPITTTNTVTRTTSQTRTILVPVGSAGAFKIAENESPRPQDRVFFTYNYYGDLRGPQSGPIAPSNTNQTFVTGNPADLFAGNPVSIANVNTLLPGLPQLNANLHREIFGFEKTFLNGFASVELRLPLLQQRSNIEGFAADHIGDLTIIGKYAFLLDQTTGNVISAGLAVTAPTGPGIDTIDGNIHSTLIQPWGGYIWNLDRFFVQGFHSVIVPTDSRDITLLCNDVGLNFWLYRGSPDRLLNFLVPSIETHVTTPLNHRDMNGPFVMPDLVVMTGGVHLGMFRNATLTVAAATPVT